VQGLGFHSQHQKKKERKKKNKKQGIELLIQPG
jgi:hypothetical protein